MQKLSRKLILLLIAIISVSFIQAQDTIRSIIPVDTNTNLITYAGGSKEDGVQYELYKRGIEWLNANFKNPADVTRVRDDVNGEIQGVYRIALEKIDQGVHVKTGTVEYSFSLQFKDNKYRYKFTNFYLMDKSRYPIEKWLDKKNPGYSYLWDEYLSQVNRNIIKLIDSLKKTMKGKKAVKDDW